MNIFRPTFLAAGFLILLLAGCSSGYKVGGIVETVVDFRPTEASLLESSGILTLRFTNENIYALGFSGSSHKLFLNGSYVGKGLTDQPFGIPPLSSITHNVTVHFENLALLRQLLAVRDQQTAAYRLESVLYQTIDEEKSQQKVQCEGALDLRALAATTK